MAKQLANKPLVEAHFEVRWQLAEASDGMVHDPMYPFIIARFSDKIRDHYPVREALPAARIPDEFTPFIAKYIFRKAENEWPAVQVGPGTASLNFDSAYHWDAFRDAALQFYSDLASSYSDDAQYPFQPITMLLRYINLVEIGPEEDPLDFVSRKLNTQIQPPASLPGNQSNTSVASLLDLRLAYPLATPAALGALRVTLNSSTEMRAVLWELNIFSNEEEVPKTYDAFCAWLEHGHKVIEDWFFSMIEGELENEFGEASHD